VGWPVPGPVAHHRSAFNPALQMAGGSEEPIGRLVVVEAPQEAGEARRPARARATREHSARLL